MDRRKFIKDSSLAAGLVAVSPLLTPFFNDPVPFAQKIIFVFRGVAYGDAFNAFKKFNILPELSFHIQKVTGSNQSYTHAEGLKTLLGKDLDKVSQTQLMDRYTIPQVIEDAFKDPSFKIIYFHHTEIGHSSNKLYMESLELFFTELSKYFYKDQYKIIVTADIGRNEKPNSCGGRDHSNPTCQETFALFMGGKASRLAAKNKNLLLKQVMKQKF